jgi:multidrug efflux pump subunit AcrA (membrane-fusion protein)
MASHLHVYCFLIIPNMEIESRPKNRLWKMAHDCNLAIKIQRIRDDNLTRLAIRGSFAKCREFAANLEHHSKREPIRFLDVTEINRIDARYQVHFGLDKFDEFDDEMGRIFSTADPAKSRLGSSGGANAPSKPSVYDTETAGSASASTIRRQLEIAQEAVDQANDAILVFSMEASRLRSEAAAAAGREAAERRAREAEREAERRAREAEREAERLAREAERVAKDAALEAERLAREAERVAKDAALEEVARLRKLLEGRT